MALRVESEPHIEVHEYRYGAVPAVAFFALVVQGFLPKYFPNAAPLLELPLLVTLYFGLSRRNPAAGLGLGMVIGLLQDGISRTPIGLYGIAKTIVGYAASFIGSRLNTEHPIARFFLALLFFTFHQGIVILTRRVLLAQPESFFSLRMLLASLINAALAVVFFPLLDHLRKPL